MSTAFLSSFLFVGFPYLVLGIAVVGSAMRFHYRPFSYSSLSSQFLENDQLFWASNLWHWGILWVLGGHLLAFLCPGRILAWNAQPLRLAALEVSGLAFGIMALFGVAALVFRRLTHPRIKAVTTRMDLVILALLLVQVVLGLCTALFYRWGSSWYAAAVVPYLRSLLTLSPRPQFVGSLPWLAKAHLLNGFLILGLVPFTRLVHALVVPIWYLWRLPQQVIWNRPRR